MKPMDDMDLFQPMKLKPRPAHEQMRREDRRMDDREAGYLFDEAEYAVLSTCGDDGWPYGVPISFASVGQKVYFHCAPEGRKLNNLKQNPKACMTVVANVRVLPEQFTTKYQSVILSGTVFEVTEEDEKLEALMLLVKKYSSGFEVSGERYARSAMSKVAIYGLTIESLTGKENK